MKIQHVTYEASRSGRPTAQKFRDYFASPSNRLSFQEDEEGLLSAGAERPVTMWPRIGNQISPSDNLPEMTAYLTQKVHLERAARKQEKLVKSTNLSGNYLPLKDDKEKAENPAAAKLIPILRRKPKFAEIVKEKLGNRSSNTASKHASDREENLAKMQDLQRRIKSGKIERVVPPAQLLGQESCLAPPIPAHSPFHDPSRLSSSSANSHQKPKSAPSKFSEYIGTSADLLDETRRELAGKFRPPFEHLSYHSFSLTRKASISSASSEDSFYCVDAAPSRKRNEGREVDVNAKAVKALKNRQREHSLSGRVSGKGTNPWTSSPREPCRLCRKPGVRGVRGLCEECERDFMRPKTTRFEGDGKDDEDEIKPTPPLKDWKTLSMRWERSERRSAFHVDGEEVDDQRPRVPVKDSLKLASAGSKTKIVKPAPVPVRQASQKAAVEEETEEEEKFRR